MRHDGSVNLTGTMVGRQVLIPGTRGRCSFKTKQANLFRISLAGTHAEGRAPRVVTKDLEETKLVVGVLCDGSAPQEYRESIVAYIPYGHTEFLGPAAMMGDGTLQPDGSRRYTHDPGTAEFKLTLRRAR